MAPFDDHEFSTGTQANIVRKLLKTIMLSSIFLFMFAITCKIESHQIHYEYVVLSKNYINQKSFN
jgi:hypothetical protein